MASQTKQTAIHSTMGYGSDSDNDDSDEEDINDFYGALPTADSQGSGLEDGAVDLRIPGAEHLLVLMDCSADMFVPSVPVKDKHRHFDYEKQQQQQDDDDDVSMTGNGSKHDPQKQKQQPKELMTPVDAVLKSLQELIRQTVRNSVKTRSGKRNGFGLTLYGTRTRSRLPIWKDVYGRERQHNSNNKSDDDSDNNDDNDSDDDDSESDSDDDNVHKKRSTKANRSCGETTVHHVIPLEVPGILTIKSLRQCLQDPSHNHERRLDLQEEFLDAVGDDKNGNKKHVSKKGGESLLTALNDITHTFREAPCVKRAPNNNAAQKLGDDTKTIWIFTNQDNPTEGETDEQRQEQAGLLQTTASDLQANGYKIMVFPLPNKKSDHPFQLESFFGKIAQAPSHLLAASGHDQDEDYELDLAEVLAGHWKTVRVSFTIPLLFPDQIPEPQEIKQESSVANSKNDTTATKEEQEEDEQSETQPEEDPSKTGIMLDFFLPVQFQIEPPKVKILREVGVNDDNVELEYINYQIVESTGEKLALRKKSDITKEAKAVAAQQPGLARIRKFHQLGKGKDYIPITNEELAELKRKSNVNSEFASLVLLGFKHPSAVPFHHNVKSYFVYPNDTSVEGSTEAFAHLHQSMLKKNVVGIGEMLMRKTATSKLVAIHAFAEEVEETGDEDSDDDDGGAPPFIQQKYPPGWVVSQLPFENELRAMTVDESLEDDFDVTPEVLAATETLVKEMFGQECDLASEFKNPYLEKFWDYIESIAMEEEMPLDKDYIISPLDEEALQKMHSLVKSLNVLLPKDEDKKRSADKLSADGNTNWLLEYQKGNLALFKNDDLKIGLKKYDQKVSGSKAALVARLADAIRAQDKVA